MIQHLNQIQLLQLNLKKDFQKLLPIYNRNKLTSIKLSTKNTTDNDWVVPSTHMICKLTKAKLMIQKNLTIKIATNLVNDCFTNQCSNVEEITINNLLQNSKADMKYTYVDDARVSQSIQRRQY